MVVSLVVIPLVCWGGGGMSCLVLVVSGANYEVQVNMRIPSHVIVYICNICTDVSLYCNETLLGGFSQNYW